MITKSQPTYSKTSGRQGLQVERSEIPLAGITRLNNRDE